MYRKNRPLWLEYSRKNLKRFPVREERYKAFLRECYPRTKPFSLTSIIRTKQELNLEIPLDELITYGNERNWLTLDGLPYRNVKTFCTVWNGIWLEKQRYLMRKKTAFY